MGCCKWTGCCTTFFCRNIGMRVMFKVRHEPVGGVGRVCPQGGITGTKPREAYGVRGACSRFRTAPHIRQRERAPRTPYASRDTTALVIRLCNLLRIPRKSAQKKQDFRLYYSARRRIFEIVARRAEDRRAVPAVPG